jgi:hypothetical protein
VRTRFEHRSVGYYVDTLGFTNADWCGDDLALHDEYRQSGATILQPPR